MSKKHKRLKKRHRWPGPNFQLPPKLPCKIENLPKDTRELMRYLLLSVVKSYPPEIFEGIGLEKCLENTEALINKGWICLVTERTFTDPVGYNDSNFYHFNLWHPFRHKYVEPGSPEALHDDPRDYWPEEFN